MKNKIFLRFTCLVLIAVLLIPLLVGGASASSLSPLDAFKRIDVMDDLSDPNTRINGKAFSAADYPANPFGEMQLLSLVEFGYSEAGDQRNFGLFLYIYNPAQIQIDMDSDQHKVQICRLFKEDGSYKNFEKFQLEICSSYDEGRFLKCYVKGYYPYFNLTGRRYAVSGFELKSFAATNAIEYTVGGDYTFTGYAKGFGKDSSAASSLECKYKGMDTIRLDLRHTFYRTNGNVSGDVTIHNQLTSVWFTIPEEYVSNGQSLHSIHASWVEAKTVPILVTSDYDFYEDAFSNRFYTLKGDLDESVPYYLLGRSTFADQTYFDWTYNAGKSDWIAGLIYNGRVSQLPFVFYSPQVKTPESAFDYLFTWGRNSLEAGSVERTILQHYFNDYPTDDFENVEGRLIPSDLIESAKPHDPIVTLDDVVNLETYQDKAGAFAAFLKYGFDFEAYDDGREVVPFEILELSAFEAYAENQSDAVTSELANKLLVSTQDVRSLYADVKAASENNGKVVLFRFAKSDYEAFNVLVQYRDKSSNVSPSYIAKMSVFLDFDVIDLTFENDGSYVVIPVVCDPIDIYSDVTDPGSFGPADNDWLQRLIAIILLVLLIIIIINFFPGVVKILIAIIAFPFNLIGSLIDYFRKRRR